MLEGSDPSLLVDRHVELEDQLYSSQLEVVLHKQRQAMGRAWYEEGYRALPIEEILPLPAHIPHSFRGKTWLQIEQEDEVKVERLVRQFRGQRFLCYFDSDSLARFGRKTQEKIRLGHESDATVFPLLVHDEDDYVVISNSLKRWRFHMASRCQVVKVNQSTQTVQNLTPAVRQTDLKDSFLSSHSTNQEPAEIPSEATPEVEMDRSPWRLPLAYSHIVTPLHPQTSVVYLLCSPCNPVPNFSSLTSSAAKHCRRKKRPVNNTDQEVKVKYKRSPLKFYDPSRNRILKNAPKRSHNSSAPSTTPLPACVRQLFRSLSPDLNTKRLAIQAGRDGSSASESPLVKTQKSPDKGLLSATAVPLRQASGSHFLLRTLHRSPTRLSKQQHVRDTGRSYQSQLTSRAGRPAGIIQVTTMTQHSSRRKKLSGAIHPGTISSSHMPLRKGRGRRRRR